MNIDRFNSLNKKLNKLMPLITPTGVVLALILGSVFAPLKPIVNPLFGVMTFLGAMKISFKDMLDALKKPLFIIVFALASYIAMPLLAELISVLFFSANKSLGIGYNLVRAIPTAVVGSIWAGIYQGNIAVSLAILLLDTALAPFMTPFMLKIFTGTAVQIDSIGMMKSLVFMVVIPFALGLVFNHFCKKQIKEYLGPISNPFSKIVLLFVIIINVSQVSKRIIEEASWTYILVAMAAVILALVGFPVGYFLCRIFKLIRSETVSITFAVAMRNISAALVLAIGYLPESAALPVIFSIVFQQTTAAIMGHAFFAKETIEKTEHD